MPLTEPSPIELADVLSLNMAEQMAALTDDDAERIAEVVGIMARAKVAALRDHAPRSDTSASAAAAQAQLDALSVPGAILLGDIADLITNMRMKVLVKAMRRG